MAAHVLRLRLALLAGAFRGDPSAVTRAVFAVLAVAIAVAAAGVGVLGLADASDEALLAVTVLGGSAVTLGFFAAPLLLAVDDPLDPRRFAVLGLAPRPLAAIVALVGLVSVPLVAVVVVAVCAAVAWSAHGVPWPIGALSVVLVALTCGLAARLGMGLNALLLRSRRTRELTGVFVVAVLVVVVPVVVFLASLDWQRRVPRQVTEAAHVLAVTPLGAAWGLPGEAAESAAGAWASVAVGLLTVAVLAGAWVLLVGRLLTTTERSVPLRERTGLGWFAVLPGTTTGAIAARSLLYWTTDLRYLVNLAVVPVAAVLAAVPLLVAGVPFVVAVLVPVPIAALLFGWLPHDDLAFDSTAVWMHIAGGVRGWADRVGRLVPIVLIAAPVLAVGIPLAIAAHGRWSLLPAMIGVCASLFLSGLGLSSIASAVAPYPVTRPGDSPFQQPQRTGSGSAMTQAAVLLGALVASAPALWFGWLAATGDRAAIGTAFWLGLGVGVGVMVVGIAIGAAVFERSGGRLMEFAEAT